MIASLRRQFNEAWTPAKYARFLAILAERFGEPTPFRHAETPCFLPAELVDGMARAGVEMVEQLLADEEYRRVSSEAIPAAWRVPNEDARPLFVQADFGLDENFHPKLVEIQGFPSLYAYQPMMALAYREAYGLERSLEMFPGHLDMTVYAPMLREAILGAHHPENVVLFEIDPPRQKTRHDFAVTQQWFGVRAVDIRAVRKRGNRLYYDRDGVQTPIRRIYNRAIVDEIERRQIALPFDYRDELDVEWAGHPNWFFRLSKFSLPYLRHPAAPRTLFLDQAGTVEDSAAWVLKPLWSFAGAGVIVGPTAEEIAAVPAARRHNWVLQERVHFRPAIETPEGPTKLEVRIMYIQSDRLRPVNTVIRMGRGAQMGVDHNRQMAWVGASAAFLRPGGER